MESHSCLAQSLRPNFAQRGCCFRLPASAFTRSGEVQELAIEALVMERTLTPLFVGMEPYCYQTGCAAIFAGIAVGNCCCCCCIATLVVRRWRILPRLGRR